MLELRTSIQDVCAYVTCPRAAHYLRTNRFRAAKKRDAYHSVSAAALRLFFSKFDKTVVDDLDWACAKFKRIAEKEIPSGADRADYCGRFSILAGKIAKSCSGWAIRSAYPNANISHLMRDEDTELRVDIECLSVLEKDGIAGILMVAPDSELWSRILHRSLPAYIIRRASRGIPGLRAGKSFITVIDPSRDSLYPIRLWDRVKLPGDSLCRQLAAAYSLRLTYPTRADRICATCPFSSHVCPFGK